MHPQANRSQRSPTLKPLAGLLAVAVLIAALSPAPARAQGTFDPWIFWTEVSVHQLHLPTAQILFWAYSGNSSWLYDPAQPIPFIEVPNARSNTFCSGHAALADGSYLVGGGIDLAAGVLTSDNADIFDISTSPGSWVAQQDMTADRFYPTLTTLGDGRVIVIGGTGTNADIPEIFDPLTGAWTQLPGAQLGLGIYPFMFLLPDGTLFFSGPSIVSAVLNTATGWSAGPVSTNDGASAVMYEPGKVMKCGGFATANMVTETIDMTAVSPAWSTQGNMAFERHDHSLTILPDGTVLAVGGHDSADVAVLPAEIWDPQTGNWTTTASLGIPRQYHSTSMLTADGRVMVGGSDGFASVEFYNPPYLAAGPRPAITAVASQITYGQVFTLRWTAFAKIAKVTFLRLGAETHSFDQNQRYVELASQQQGPIGITPSGQMAGTLSVTAPANGNIAPPGFYLIFAVDNQGRPSVGEYVQIM